MTAADFALGTLDANTEIALPGDGELVLKAKDRQEFSGTALPAGWQAVAWSPGTVPTVGGGLLTMDGGHAGTVATFGPGRSLEFVATFQAEVNQHIGFTADLAFNAP